MGQLLNNLIDLIRENPYQTPPPYEKLPGDLHGAYSRRINIKHRLVYEVIEKEHIIKIISLKRSNLKIPYRYSDDVFS